jgi:DNA-binding NarL/FixJ family response regulator
MTPAIRFVVADPIDLVTLGIESLLTADREHLVVARVQSGTELEAALTKHQPDVLIASDQFDGLLSPFRWTERIRQIAPRVRIILLGTLSHGPSIHALLSAGVLGYLHLYDPLELLINDAIATVMQGKVYLSTTASAEFLTSMQRHKGVQLPLDAESQELLHLIAAGYHTGQIALKMRIDRRRVYSLRQRLREKFGADTNEHLISLAADYGLTRQTR